MGAIWELAIHGCKPMSLLALMNTCFEPFSHPANADRLIPEMALTSSLTRPKKPSRSRCQPLSRRSSFRGVIMVPRASRSLRNGFEENSMHATIFAS
jgi:hypothetical protein